MDSNATNEHIKQQQSNERISNQPVYQQRTQQRNEIMNFKLTKHTHTHKHKLTNTLTLPRQTNGQANERIN